MDDIFLQLSKLTGGTEDDAQAPANLFTSAGLSTDDEEMFKYDNLLAPTVKPQKSDTDKKVILVIDDDFATLDLMKIYLQRNYEYVAFDNPKDAIFWINGHIPDLIFMDCYLTLIKTKRVVEIIHSYEENKNVPIFYLSEPDELGAISSKLPEGVQGVISRPVGRGDLQGVLNYVFQD